MSELVKIGHRLVDGLVAPGDSTLEIRREYQDLRVQTRGYIQLGPELPKAKKYSGAVGGTITISAGSEVQVPVAVYFFAGVPGATIQVDSDANEIAVTVPTGAADGPVAVVGSDGKVAVVADFTLDTTQSK